MMNGEQCVDNILSLVRCPVCTKLKYLKDCVVGESGLHYCSKQCREMNGDEPKHHPDW